ncbi:hypothetical protein V2W45_1489621 [Cenococcum geophilum]
MPPAFGFSVGDFIATIELCTKVAKALKDTGGASSEYQSVIIELHGLQNVLARLAALEPTESNLSHVNAIRGMALACRLPLADFFSKLEKYEAAMGPLATSHTLRGAGKKIQWAVFMADEVRKIRAMISAKVISINLLLAMHASETLSRMESYSSSHYQQLFEKLEEHTVCMQKILRGVDSAKNEMLLSHEASRREASGSSDRLQQGLDNVNVGMESVMQRLSSLSMGFASAHTSLVTLRILSSQIVGFLRSFPTELRTLLDTVIRTNMRMYVMLLSIHERVSTSPTLLLQSNIQFENALGVTQELPYEWFRSWEIFEGLLKTQFKDAPGACKVDAGRFRLVHAKRPSVSIDRDTWTQAITPGAEIIMLMIITDIACQLSSCPRPSCTGKPSFDLGEKEILTCPACGLRFMPQLSAIQGSVGSLNGLEVDQVAKIQVEEDAKLFGSRDLSNVGGGKDSPSHTPQVEELPEDVEMLDADDNEFSNVNLNQPTSPPPSEPPIFSWLADTLPPANPGSVIQWREAEEHRQSKQKKQEIDNIEVFRNVQVSVSLESELSADPARKAPSDEDELELGARIYYRNIIDRYPRIERFLARRSAEGNWERAKRLACAQDQAVEHAFPVAQNETPVQNESDEPADLIIDEGYDHVFGGRQERLHIDKLFSPEFQENFSMPQTYPEFQENYWTQQSVPASPVSSANTPLREADYSDEQKSLDSYPCEMDYGNEQKSLDSYPRGVDYGNEHNSPDSYLFFPDEDMEYKCILEHQDRN